VWGDWRDRQIRNLVHFDGAGAGMRFREEPLQVGDELSEGDGRYEVERVEQRPSVLPFEHAWAERSEG
jgi:hypothetical protein